MIFGRNPLFYAKRRRRIKWIYEDLLIDLAAPPVACNWILALNSWDDAGCWDDSEIWND